ncbi:hypothetical protein D3C84_871370 [compost metagenome]
MVADVDLANLPAPGTLGCGGCQFTGLDGLARMRQECQAGSGQRHPTVFTAEQCQPQFRLKRSHQLAQCRLRNTQLFGRPAEVLQVGGDHKGF